MKQLVIQDNISVHNQSINQSVNQSIFVYLM